MTTDTDLLQLAARVGQRLVAARQRLVTAESCTGGWIAKAITDAAGSSQWFECGYVTYSNEAKTRDLHVSIDTLERHGAVSKAVVLEMAEGALRVSGADVSIAVSGVAGPDGGTPDKPVGTVWFCVGRQVGPVLDLATSVQRFDGDREAVRRKAVEHALKLLLQPEQNAADPFRR